MPTAEIKDIGDLVPDPANCRKHNPRNIGSIVNSLQKVGAARSIVIDEDNVILAGNGLIEAAGEAGITKVKVVEADGNTVIAVRRKGLTPKQKAELAISDNRTAELATWDAEQLLQTLSEHKIDFADVEFTEAELKQLNKGTLLDPNAAGKEYDESVANDVKKCTCPKCGHEFPL